MKSTALAVLAVASVVSVAVSGAYAASTTVTNSDNCMVVRLKPGESPPTNGMSTSVTAGNGTVSGQTTTGNGVAIQGGGSSVGTSVATSSSSDGRTTTVNSSNGNCTVYVQPNK
jgi:hypothetical protein